jgi:hypothetical protein
MRAISFFVLLIGALGIGLCLWAASYDFERMSWPKTTATVIAAGTQTVQDPDGLSLDKPYAKFAYTLGGKTYRSQADLGLATNLQGPIQDLMIRFAVGTKHEVPYNPKDPKELRPNVRIEGIALFALIGGLSISLVAAISGVRLLFHRPPLYEREGAGGEGERGNPEVIHPEQAPRPES